MIEALFALRTQYIGERSTSLLPTGLAQTL
jgi:hypothetical protein